MIAIALSVTAGALWAGPLIKRETMRPLTGTVRIVGSRDAAIPVSHWASILKREHPEVQVVTMLYGSGTGAGALADGAADLVPLFRTLRPSERALIMANGGAPQSTDVGLSSANGVPLRFYYTVGSNPRADRIAAELVEIARSPEGRQALKPIP